MTASDVVDMATGELLYESNQELTADKLHKIIQSGVTSFEVFFPERDDVGQHYFEHAASRLRPQA